MKRFLSILITFLFLTSFLISGCGDSKSVKNDLSNNTQTEEQTRNQTEDQDKTVSTDTSLMRLGQESGSVHLYLGKINEVSGMALGIVSNISEFPEIPFTSDNEIVAISMEEVYVPEDSQSYSISYNTTGDSGLTQSGDEWLILYEGYNKETGIYNIITKVTFNNVIDIRDFSIYNLLIDTKKTRNKGDDALIGYDEAISFRDGSAGKTTLKDLDNPSDGNLLKGILETTNVRNYTTIKEIEGSLFQITTLLNTPNLPDDDEIVRLFRGVKFVNGVISQDELIPNPPIHYGEEPISGTYKLNITFPKGELKSYLRLIDFKADKSGVISEKWIFIDETEGKRKTTYNAEGLVTVEAINRDGTKLSGVYNKADGSYKQVIIPPEDHPVKQIDEVGKIKVDENENVSGKIHREIIFKGSDEIYKEDIAFAQEKNIVKIKTENNLGGHGETMITKNPESVTVEGRITDKDGKVTDYVELHYADGTSKQLFFQDDPNTIISPDVQGEIEFASDGSGIGTIIVYNEDKTFVTYYIIFNGNGTGSIVDSEGNHKQFGY